MLAGEPIRQPEGARAYREPERLLSAPAAGRKSPERTEAGPEEERLRVYRSSGERDVYKRQSVIFILFFMKVYPANAAARRVNKTRCQTDNGKPENEVL